MAVVRILGIDPGSQITGFGVIQQQGRRQDYVASGCIRVGNYEWPERLTQIFQGISKIIHEYQPHMVAIEQVFVHKNVSSALKLGQARGVAMVAAASLKLAISEYSAKQIKKAVVGYGNAEKGQIQQMIRVLLCLNALPQKDAADALAVAICHGQSCNGAFR